MKFRFLLILMLLAAFTSCRKQESQPGPEASPSFASPLSPLTAPVLDSPLPTPSDNRFHLDRPIAAGATAVSGRGPAGIPLQVVNITDGGEILGNGVIDDDGHFAIGLGVPVPPHRVIGIRLDGPKDPDTWLDLWALRGEDARFIPQAGEFFDTVISANE